MYRFLSALIVASALLSLGSVSACTTASTTMPPLGPISATGTLIPAEVSLLRRGTHVLMINGKKMYYVESKTEDLVSVQGQTVHIEGIAEANTSKSDLPVLVVQTLISVKGETGLHVWNIPALDIRIQTPNAWKAGIEKKVASFFLPNELVPLLVVTVSGSGSLPISGKQTYLSGRRSVRIDGPEGSGRSDVFVQGTSFILHLHFDVSTQKSIERLEDAKLLESQFDYTLSSLKFLSDTSVSVSGSGSSTLPVCGGEAGILCPAGSFCNVTDPALNIGRCQTIKS